LTAPQVMIEQLSFKAIASQQARPIGGATLTLACDVIKPGDEASQEVAAFQVTVEYHDQATFVLQGTPGLGQGVGVDDEGGGESGHEGAEGLVWKGEALSAAANQGGLCLVVRQFALSYAPHLRRKIAGYALVAALVQVDLQVACAVRQFQDAACLGRRQVLQGAALPTAPSALGDEAAYRIVGEGELMVEQVKPEAHQA